LIELILPKYGDDRETGIESQKKLFNAMEADSSFPSRPRSPPHPVLPPILIQQQENRKWSL
jgi:hypothetical protein